MFWEFDLIDSLETQQLIISLSMIFLKKFVTHTAEDTLR